MATADPLTFSSDIQRVITPSDSHDKIKHEKPLKPDLGEFSGEVLNISNLDREKKYNYKQAKR